MRYSITTNKCDIDPYPMSPHALVSWESNNDLRPKCVYFKMYNLEKWDLNPIQKMSSKITIPNCDIISLLLNTT